MPIALFLFLLYGLVSKPSLMWSINQNYLNMANLSEVKKELNVQTINLNTVSTEAGEKTSWMKQWDNEGRVAILIHKDTLAKIKANPSISTLGINTQVKQGAKGEYTAKTICVYADAEETL